MKRSDVLMTGKAKEIKERTDKKRKKSAINEYLSKDQVPFFVMAMLPVAFFVFFRYLPMAGVTLAFQDYKTGQPFLGAQTKWVGFKWFKKFLTNPKFFRYFKNTLVLSLLSLFVSFPVSIAFALLVNEIRRGSAKKFVSNVSLLPHFISTTIIVGLLYNLFSIDNGLVNNIIAAFGGKRIDFLQGTSYFRALYTGSGIWQQTGFNAIVFTAAIAGINPALYEAAAIDGSSRWKNVFLITIPCILPTIITMFLLKTGSLLSSNTEKIILMYNPANYEVSDTLGTYAYRAGLTDMKMSLSTAISLFDSVCNIILLTLCNRIAHKKSETSLW